MQQKNCDIMDNFIWSPEIIKCLWKLEPAQISKQCIVKNRGID